MNLATDPVATVVVFAVGRVEIWGGEADVAEVALKLPRSTGQRSLMRVALAGPA